MKNIDKVEIENCNINNKNKSNIMKLVIVIFIILLFFSRNIARFTIEVGMSEFEKMTVFFRTEIMQLTFDELKENGMLYAYPDSYKEEAVAAIEENFEGEKAEMYKQILLGGFSANDYLKDHSFEEFYDVITEMDVCLPDYYCKNEYDDREYNYTKVTYWKILYNKYASISSDLWESEHRN